VYSKESSLFSPPRDGSLKVEEDGGFGDLALG
jgi:hypothetical protein